MVVKDGDNTASYKNIKREISHSEKKRKRSRLNFNIPLFMQGKIETLNSDEFVFDLIDYISARNSDQEQKVKLLKKLGKSSLSDDINFKERSLMVLSLAAEAFISDNSKEFIILTTKLLTEWLYFEKEIISGYSVIVNRIGDLIEWLLLNKCWEDAESNVAVISKIQSDELKRDRVVKVLITSVQVKLADPLMVEILTTHYLKRDEKQEVYKNLLVSLGPGVVSYLLERITICQNQQDKSSLTDLILCFGEIAIPALVGFLEKRPANDIISIIFHVMSELMEDSLCEHVRWYLSHEDVNVQHGAVRCIILSAAEDVQMRLMEALGKVDNILKHKIIRYLAEAEGELESVATELYKLAEERLGLKEPDDADFLKFIAVALKQYPFPKTIELLETMQAKFKNIPKHSELAFQINESLRVLKPLIRHNLRRIDRADQNITFDNDPVQQQIALKKVRKIEEEMKYALAAGDSEAAGQIIYRESIAAAGEKDFQTAELLRDRMLEIDPMALSDVLLLSETIEQEKENTVSSESLQMWTKLDKEMSSGQRDIFYDGLRQERYAKDTIISHSGEIDPSLYFISSGHVGLSGGTDSNEIFLKKMQPGDILGAEQFFSASVCTVTLKALTDVRVQVLDRDSLKEIKVNFPEIEDILKKFSRQYVQIPELLEMSGEDRRVYPRHSGNLVIKNVLLGYYGKKGNYHFKGKLIDISKGGLSFNVKISGSKKARLLLGRQIISTIPVGNTKCIQGVGVIVGIGDYNAAEEEFCLHVELLKKIDQEMMQKISNYNEMDETIIWK